MPVMHRPPFVGSNDDLRNEIADLVCDNGRFDGMWLVLYTGGDANGLGALLAILTLPTPAFSAAPAVAGVKLGNPIDPALALQSGTVSSFAIWGADYAGLYLSGFVSDDINDPNADIIMGNTNVIEGENIYIETFSYEAPP